MCRGILVSNVAKIGQNVHSIVNLSQKSPSPTSWRCTILELYPSCSMALSAGQLPREMYSRLMLSINGVCKSC